MFIKITTSGGHRYVRLVESFRNADGQPRQRTVATLGRLGEPGGQLDLLMGRLLSATGRIASDGIPPQVRFESALALGDVWALDQLWRELGFDALGAIFRRARYTTPVEHAIRVMVFNRLCDPDSKLGVLRWLQTVSMPSIDTKRLTHQHLLRSMDALMDHQAAVDDCVAALLRPLVDVELSVVFYDLTTIRTEGLSEQDGDLRQYGMSKEGLIARQLMLGVVQTAEGMPIYHEVFCGNTSEAPTLQPTLRKVLARFPHIRRLIVVADRGLLSLDNMEALSQIEVANGQPLEFILAVPARRYADFEDILQPLQDQATQTPQEFISEARWQRHRLVVAHNPERAREQTDKRRQRIHALQNRAAKLANKLDAQDAGQVRRGRKLSDSGAKARFFHEVCDAHLSRIIKVDLKSELFTYDIDDQAQRRAELMDGKLLLVTNVPAADLSATQILQRYKALADIERGFKVLKSEIEIAPVFHRLPERIKAHASLCFMALIVYRVMRQRLKLANSDLSPEVALDQLRRIQQHTVSINSAAPISGISTIDQNQAAIFSALKTNKPSSNPQLSLL